MLLERLAASKARSSWRAALTVAAVATLFAPAAHAGLMGDRIEVSMYGRVGLAWTPTGQLITGRSMNLTGSPQGGRFEEGDYLEPTIKFHILKPEKADDTTAPWIQAVITPAMFARNGSFLGVFSNSFDQTLGIELFQAYLEAGNVLTQDLKLWAGARFYRGQDVHIADYFYFNNLSGQGAGVKWRGLDVAVLLQTAGPTSQYYNYDSNGDGTLDSRRQRTVLVGQYVQPLGTTGHTVQGLAELHVLPGGRAVTGAEVLPGDYGWVLGAKAHLALPGDSFNDLSIRYGSRAASGSRAGAQTWAAFGDPSASSSTYDGAAGVELVDHFLYNVNALYAVNAYGILHWNRGASSAATDNSMDFAVGARNFFYLHNNLHLIGELSFQGLQAQGNPLGTAFKFSLVPTIVPSGQRSVWARPHLRLIYTLAVYNDVAKQNYPSPFLQTVGSRNIGHYFGARAEWWF